MIGFVKKAFSKIPGKGEAGVTLIATLVALALMGSVAVVVSGAMGVALHVNMDSDEQATGMALAQSQLENTSNQAYIDYSINDHGEYPLVTPPATYSVEVAVVPIASLTGQALPSNQDDGLQKIQVTVKRNGEVVAFLEGYKADL